MVKATLVSDLLTEIVPGLETRVREGLSRSGCHLSVVDTRVRQGKGSLAITIVDSVHS
jgi:hypothetical protein